MATLGGRLPIPALVAHQGGWDEILLVAGPILVILGVLVLARQRISRLPPHPEPDAPTVRGADERPDLSR